MPFEGPLSRIRPASGRGEPRRERRVRRSWVAVFPPPLEKTWRMILGDDAVEEVFCCMEMLGPALAMLLFGCAFSPEREHSLHSARTSRMTETAGLMALRWRA